MLITYTEVANSINLSLPLLSTLNVIRLLFVNCFPYLHPIRIQSPIHLQ